MPANTAEVEYRTILVPLDGSPLAETVLPLATAIARATNAQLILARVHEPPKMAMTSAYDWNREVELRELDYLCVVAGRIERTVGICAHTKLLPGHPGDAICLTARNDKTLIVMSSHGRTGFSRFWLGSVADAVVRGARGPVLMVRCGGEQSNEPPASALGKVLVPLDGSRAAEAIVPHAVWLCRALGASLELLHVIPFDEIPSVEPALEDDATQAAIRAEQEKLCAIVERLRGAAKGTAMSVAVRVHESPAAAIGEYAAATGVGVVALTTRGSGLARLVGSVADKIVRSGPRAILLLRPPEPDAPAFLGQQLH